jgi:predicted PurR-regulated permease PerM
VALFVWFTVYSIGVGNVLYPYVVDGDVELTLLRGLFVVTGVTSLAIG